ncbi:lysophospholipid acyltransferase family protein [Spirilliplanes yamanashiensis]|uniref:1-acyl-sn-glycerol-3-phosphate acyltransferase n=1 Tax=Spirilliplanes yamanashiensis TaxID=42233 RepID=A0A8J3Y468_9ACTN|nr:lysophospholipid acyltransferase family protein [Spirilliplanes yamanashiensis]GIJ01416.1 1-acyl-sn-glycerol-3-phosphate acyltransferase [Spirilliplanes yamanashiensis]
MGRRGLGFWPRAVAGLVKPTLTVWTRRTWTGMENLPADGRGVIVASNHVSHFDPLTCSHFIYDAGRWPQFLAKASVFKVPVIGWIITQCRQIPVERGSVEAARSLDKLVAALKAGGTVVIYPEGTTTKEPGLWPMRGKTGVARLALATGAPVVPMAMWGPQDIFDPRSGKLSFRWRRPVSVTVGKPVDLSKWEGAAPTRATLDEMTEAIMLEIRGLVAGLRQEEPPPLYRPGSGAAQTGGES